ncbi:MAG: thioredoxin family protein [Thermodesulfobacteriota bacterium]
MKIQIAGPGCARCKATEEVVGQLLQELHLAAEVEHVYEVREYGKLGVMLTPAVLVDGKILFAGRVPTLDELKKLLVGSGR